MIESTVHFAETKMNAAKFPEANFPAIRVRCTKPGALSDYADQTGVSADLASART
jgi:multidrug efflux pump subunit AcrB